MTAEAMPVCDCPLHTPPDQTRTPGTASRPPRDLERELRWAHAEIKTRTWLLQLRDAECDRQRAEIHGLERRIRQLQPTWADPMAEAAMGVVNALARQHGIPDQPDGVTTERTH